MVTAAGPGVGCTRPRAVTFASSWPRRYRWNHLVHAFGATYGSDELQKLESGAAFLRAIEEDDNVSLTEADLAYLRALEEWLGTYPEMRTTKE